jgi:phage terminase small subunit
MVADRHYKNVINMVHRLGLTPTARKGFMAKTTNESDNMLESLSELFDK